MLGGYKTKIAGVGSILAGLSTIAMAVSSTPIDLHQIGMGLTGVIGGLTVLGIGGKLQKIVDALKTK